MQTTNIQTSYIPSDQAAQVIAMAARRDNKSELTSFASNYDHLQALEYEAKLMVAIASIRYGRASKEDEELSMTARFPFLPEGTDLKQITTILEEQTSVNRCREELARQNGIMLNFIDFCDKWELDGIERKIVQLLLMQFSSASFFTIYDASGLERRCDNGMEIGALLSIVSEDLGEELAHRHYFSIHGKLVQNELLHSNCQYMDNTTSVLRTTVYLQERYVRYIVGDSNHYHVAFKFIQQERSSVRLDQVVLPNELKEGVVKHAERYLTSRRSGDFEELDDFYGYGTGLAYLFHGPSGTGKTMLAKGLANHLSCPLISFNIKDINSLQMSYIDILEMLFREATLLGGIVFLDECDDIFRNDEDSQLSRSLLLEIEKSRCITILATNKPVELDPAMDRRLSMKVLFTVPDAGLRLKMWKVLIPPTATLGTDVDLALLAERFHFTGGLIKNSILMAITAVDIPDGSRPVLTQEALVYAAELQTATMSDLNRICEVHKPIERLDTLPLGCHQRDQLLRFAKASEWLLPQEMGFNLLFNCNDISTGVRTVFGLAAELGMTVRAFDFSKVASVSEHNMVIDSITQRRVYPMIAAFSSATSDQSLMLFVDDAAEFGKFLATGTENTTQFIYPEFLSQLRIYKGLFCFVTKGIKEECCPAEFHQIITLSYPPEELQMKQWETALGTGVLNDDELVSLAEQHPMHTAEIDFIARQAKVSAIVNGRSALGIEDVNIVLARHRGKSQAQVLFGRQP